MADWKTVTKVFTPSGPRISAESQTRPARVNMDLVAAVLALPAGRSDGARATLLWHTTSPRCEWNVQETMEELTA